ncbi:MAG: phosphatidylglycerol lysyltransferase domain-containing protein [Desulfobulbaceae bacterium]
MIPTYPDTAELDLLQRPVLHPLLQRLPDGISEFTFANLYLFRKTHGYRVSRLADDLVLFTGEDEGKPFFLSPFNLPEPDQLAELFAHYLSMKCVSESQAKRLKEMGYIVKEDRDNFDYLYRRSDLAELTGRKFSKKRNLIKAFIRNNDFSGRPLLDELLPDAIRVLDTWRAEREDEGDYEAAREALERCHELQLCGGIYYVDQTPVAYSLGEELMGGKAFVIHFEKASGGYKGLWQFINQAFASILPDQYEFINREQDLGEEGLRAAKMSYRPVGFIKKYRASAA